jgi:thiol:disulfide interchange protein DsbC
MKKLVLITGLVGSLFASSNIPTAEVTKILSNNKVLAPYAPYVKDGYDNGNYYIFKLPLRGNPTAYVSKTGETFIGYGFDKEGKILKMPIDANVVKQGVAFSFGDEGKKDLYVVTDPECPYCAKFEKMSKGKLKDYRVHVILMPLSFHKNAKAMSYYILNGKDDAQKLKRFAETVTKQNTNYKNFTPSKEQLSIYSKYLMNSQNAAKELGATGTPMVFDAEFNQVNWPKLVK